MYQRFIKNPISPNLCTVPGIDENIKKFLSTIEITTTWQLIGLFLSFNRNSEEMEHYFSEFPSMKEYGQLITKAVAEKVYIMFKC